VFRWTMLHWAVQPGSHSGFKLHNFAKFLNQVLEAIYCPYFSCNDVNTNRGSLLSTSR